MTAPDDKTLRRFLLGQLTVAEFADVEAFIETSPGAVQTLGRLNSEDSFTERLRGSSAPLPIAPEVQVLASRLEKLTLTSSDADRTRTIGDAGAYSSQEPSITRTFEDLSSFLAPPSAAGELGRLGDYRIIRVLGEGGMGIVFEAEDVKLGRRVAVKAMKPSVAQSPTAKARFLREAKAAAAVEHDHVIPIHLIAEANGVPFLVMPYLKGESLDDRVKRERTLPVSELVRIGREVAQGLSAAHSRGLIHRDIKPGNLWLEEPGGRVKILDFGLARGVQTEGGPSSEITQSGAVIGTPAYMSPEQGRGQVLDVRSDLFSLGGVLYRMATGRQPFPGEDSASVLMALAADDPADPRTLNPSLPAGLSEVILNLLEKDPSKRPQSARELAGLLIPTIAIDVAVTPPAKRKSRRGKLIKWAVSLLLVGVILLWSPTIVRVATNKGELVVVVDDPTIEVVVKDGQAEVLDKSKDRRFILKAGDGEIQFLEPETGVTAFTRNFEIRRGRKTIVSASMADVLAARKPKPDLLPESPADERAPKDYFPGKPVVYETFDDSKTCSMFQGTFEGVKSEVVNGRYVVTSDGYFKYSSAKLGPKLEDVAFATRVRSSAAIDVAFRTRVTGGSSSYLRLRINVDSTWALEECHSNVQAATANASTRLLAKGKLPDPEFRAQRWVSIAGRDVGEDCELWLNGRLAARVKVARSDKLDLTNDALTIAAIATTAGPDRLEIDHVSVWDMKAASPQSQSHGDKLSSKKLFSGESTPGSAKLTPEEQELLSQINKERTAAKLPPLVANAKLIEAARKHAYQMAAWGKLSHESEDKTVPERMKAVGYEHTRFGENVAFVNKDITEALEAWKQSKSHRANLRDTNYVDVGIGIGRAASGEVYVSAMFAAPLAIKPIGAAERQAAEWVMLHQGRMMIVIEGKSIPLRAGSPWPASAFEVERIDFPSSTKFTDADLAILAPLSKLNVLVLSSAPIGDAAMEHVAKITSLTDLHLTETKVGDEGVLRLKALQKLRLLALSGTAISNRSASVLGSFPKLENLNLNATELSDNGVIELAKSPSLKELFLSNTAVSDKGLQSLAGLKSLRTLNLSNSKVSAEGVKKLHEALPACEIEWNGKVFGPRKE